MMLLGQHPGSLNHLEKNSVKKYLQEKWSASYKNYCRANSSGLLRDLDCSKQVVQSNRVPESLAPRVFGQVCALLTGHCRLQFHMYKLKMTFSPCCICLEEDETPEHFPFTCPLYKDTREKCKPKLGDWISIANFVYHSGCTVWLLVAYPCYFSHPLSLY